MGTHLRVLSKTYPMNTNMTGIRYRGLDGSQKSLRHCALDKSSIIALGGLSFVALVSTII